jgi:hypothetical protein
MQQRSRTFGEGFRFLQALRLLMACVALAGCVSTHFTPYSGSRAVHQGSRHGAFVELVEGMPVYYSEPDRPYRVLGVLRVGKPGPRPLAQSILTGQWMEEVRRVGGNAVWIVSERTEAVGYTYSSSYINPVYETSGEVLVLQLL